MIYLCAVSKLKLISNQALLQFHLFIFTTFTVQLHKHPMITSPNTMIHVNVFYLTELLALQNTPMN